MTGRFLRLLQKSGLAAFFVLATQPGLGQSLLAAPIQDLAQSPAWSALLHLHEGRPQVRDPNFLLSLPAFSPEAELKLTVQWLQSPDPQAVCRFPARYLWLRTRQAIEERPLEACTQWQEFRTRAPAETLSLVFASESVTAPASMMGHLFLALRGPGQDGREWAHAISFYNPADTYNFARLYWETMVSGKQGVFALTPLNEVSRKYLETEGRNLWTHDLALDAEERALLQAHMLELKAASLLYWFHAYNCATLLRNLVGVTGRLPASNAWWDTPLDVVKDVHAAGLVSRSQALVSPKWLTDQKLSAPADWQQAPEALEIPARLNPVNSPPDSQVWSGLDEERGRLRMQLGLIPLSHPFLDAPPQSLAETQLEFMSGAISTDGAHSMRLDRLTLYAMRSLNPWNPETRHWSSEFKVGYDQLALHDELRRGAMAQAALGQTRRLAGVDLYGLFGLTAGRAAKDADVWWTQEWGAVLRWGPGKLAASVRRSVAAGGTGALMERKLSWAQSVQGPWRLGLQAHTTHTPIGQATGWGLRVARFF